MRGRPGGAGPTCRPAGRGRAPDGNRGVFISNQFSMQVQRQLRQGWTGQVLRAAGRSARPPAQPGRRPLPQAGRGGQAGREPELTESGGDPGPAPFPET